MKLKLNLTIFHKLLISLLLVSLVPLCAMWYLGETNAERELTESIEHSLVTTMDTAATGINAWDDGNVRALRQAARLDDVISMQAERQNPVLNALGMTYEWSYLVFTVAPDGKNIGRNDGAPLAYFGDRSYFKDVIAGQELGRQVAIGKTSGKPTLILAVPVRNDDRALIGVMAMSMNLGDVSQTIAKTRIGQTGHAVLLDATNKVIAHGNAAKVRTALQDFKDHPALKTAGISEQPTQYMDEGKKMIGFVRKLPQGWTLLIAQDYDEAHAPLEKLQAESRTLIGVSAVLVIVVAFLLGAQLTRPIRKLTAIAIELSTGRFDVPIPQTTRTDEIGLLAQSIDRLGISMQMAMERLRKKG
jgi:methyl-accepting chemotaxis protein